MQVSVEVGVPGVGSMPRVVEWRWKEKQTKKDGARTSKRRPESGSTHGMHGLLVGLQLRHV